MIKQELIGLSGKPLDGKLMVAEILTLFGYEGFHLYSPIISAMSGLLGIEQQDLMELSVRDSFIPGTSISVSEGVNMFSDWCNDNLSSELLSSLLLKSVEPHLRRGEPVVVTGVRTADDARFIRDLGGQIWHVGNTERGNSFDVDLHIEKTDEDSDLILPVLEAISSENRSNQLLISRLKRFICSVPNNQTSVEVDRMSLELLPNVTPLYAKRIGRLGAALLVSSDGGDIPLNNNEINAIIYSDQPLSEMVRSPYLSESIKNVLFARMYFSSMGDGVIKELRNWRDNHQQEPLLSLVM